MDPNSPNKNKGTTTATTRSSNQTSPKTPPRVYVRSYTCTFCEKGFSNAQALGGHMNIHRRDRARLRNLDDSDLHHRRGFPTIISWQRDRSSSSDQLDPRLLLLFGDDTKPPGETRRSNGGGSSPGDELDLELRLGLEPPPSSSSSSPSPPLTKGP